MTTRTFEDLATHAMKLSRKLMEGALENLRTHQEGNASRSMKKVAEIMGRLESARKDYPGSEQETGPSRLVLLKSMVEMALGSLHKGESGIAEKSAEAVVVVMEKLGEHSLGRAVLGPESQNPDQELLGRVNQVRGALTALDEILDLAVDHGLDEMQEQALVTAQQVLVAGTVPSRKKLDRHAVKAVKLSSEDIRNFIERAEDYDLEQKHVDALRLALDGMIEVLDAHGQSQGFGPAGASVSPVAEVDAAAFENAARAVAKLESWDGWDDDSATPNGNTPDEQRAWCREVARVVLNVALNDRLSVNAPEETAAVVGQQALELLKQYRAAPKFSTDHDAIKRTVKLEDRIDEFLASLDPSVPEAASQAEKSRKPSPH